MKADKTFINMIDKKQDIKWLLILFIVTLVVFLWDLIFLNGPALKAIATGFVNTVFIAVMAVFVTLIAGWMFSMLLYFLQNRGLGVLYLVLVFILNLLRSIPQVVGVLFCYVAIARLCELGMLGSDASVFPIMSFCLGIFMTLEMVDLMGDRINHFKRLDFFSAMRVCGISEWRIINFDILWKNSRIHILNKLISVFGMAVFLQCSVDFIISVGLSTEINSVSLPATLGSLLAKLDSKQDILAIGYTLTHPTYFHNLFFAHLQGLSTAFLIVFTLFGIYRIGNGYAERNRL